MQNSNFKSRLAAGEKLYGTMITLPTPSTAEILAGVGFDWFFIDGEHGPLGTTEILSILQAVSHRVACIVRVPEAAEVPIKKVLDIGAHGIIVPQVNSVEQAENVVRWAKYSPDGARGVGLARAHGYGATFADYLENANDQISVIVQAEHALAVEAIEDIVKVPGSTRFNSDRATCPRAWERWARLTIRKWSQPSNVSTRHASQRTCQLVALA